MNYLVKEDFILINRKTIEKHGGNFIPPDNFLHPQELDYLVEAIDAKVFGESLYPTFADKAALYMYQVISKHVFQDGNKRTGLAAALLFLNFNGKRLKADLQQIAINQKRIPETGNTSNEILFNFTIEVASAMLSLEECQLWFSANIK